MMRLMGIATLLTTLLAAVALTQGGATPVKAKEVTIQYERPMPPPMSKLTQLTEQDMTTTTVPPPRSLQREVPRVTARQVAPVLRPRGTVALSVPSAGWSGPWICISHYESGGNPAENTGNGYYGGLQFLLQTWYAHGGVGRPDQASIAEQEAVANAVVAADHGSYREWGTAARCGLPTY